MLKRLITDAKRHIVSAIDPKAPECNGYFHGTECRFPLLGIHCFGLIPNIRRLMVPLDGRSGKPAQEVMLVLAVLIEDYQSSTSRSDGGVDWRGLTMLLQVMDKMRQRWLI